MKDPALHYVLAVGAGLPEIDWAKPHVFVVRVLTPTLAAEQMKKQQFDLVVFHAALVNEENILWLARLRRARPFLPVMVLHDGDGVPHTVETGLREAGVTALIPSKTRELQVWLGAWLARRAPNDAKRHGIKHELD